MPLPRGIAQVFEAIPERIEVSGTGPTWRVTGGSFDSVVSWANDAFDQPVVIARQDRNRWWPRVTLTVTTDPVLAAEAPPLASFIEPEPPAPEAVEDVSGNRDREPADLEPLPEDLGYSPLEELFASQQARPGRHLPEQRRPGGHRR